MSAKAISLNALTGVAIERRELAGAQPLAQIPDQEGIAHGLEQALLDDFIARGGKVWACPPCTYARGYDKDSLVHGVEIHGASVIFERINNGAATLTF